MQRPFQITFANGATAQGISLSTHLEMSTGLNALGLFTARPTLVIVGGASGLAADDLEKLRSLFQEVLCPLADELNFIVIDGGTDAGVMQLMGQARAATGGQFPLVGLVVQKKAILPSSSPPSEDAAALEPHHTHFILVPGSEWGDESGWIAEAATASSDGKPSITLLINGGAIALNQDVPNSLERDRPVLVIAGSGRSADRLANAMTGETSDPAIQSLVNSVLLHKVDLATEKDGFKAAIERILQAAQSG